jgi:hypothetical protein
MTFCEISGKTTMLNMSLDHVRGQVAKILLENGTHRQISQRNIADITGTDWEMVHASLKSLQDEGAIKIDRQRLIINKNKLKKVAAMKGRVPTK